MTGTVDQSVMEQSPQHMVPRRYRVVHRTTYTYNKPVTDCYERGLLSPRSCASQQVVSTTFTVSPTASVVHEHVDYFGNLSHYLEVPDAHTTLQITKESLVDVAWPGTSIAALNRWTLAEAVELVHRDPRHVVDKVLYELESPKVTIADDVIAYAHTLLAPEAPLGDALASLTLGIYRDFAYRPGVTTTRTTLQQLLDLRQGVCQDFAHLAIGCLRVLGLPTRYVSGYIETAPPPGQQKLEGSDASHAWASVLVPDGSWVDIDPTNAHFADSRYVVNGWGRDFADVSPLKGVITTEADSSSLSVGVDVIRVGDRETLVGPA
ncbi:transglutaminase family protein [Propionibacteriaceae bacterium G1746]